MKYDVYAYLLMYSFEPSSESFDLIIDVRSPNEFGNDHIPNSINIPVLGDEERRKVGTIYSSDPSSARGVGAAIISRSIAKIIEDHLLNLSRDTKILVYCWRGGLRSKSLAVIMNQIGFNDVKLLNGGYKSFRKHITATLPRLIHSHEYVVLAGNTGAGKSIILECLQVKGENILHLEELAKHKGSVVGTHLYGEQPSCDSSDNYQWYCRC